MKNLGKIHLAARTPGKLVISNVNVANGRAYATDGYIMARVPVELEDGDQDGLLSVEAIKEASKANRTILANSVVTVTATKTGAQTTYARPMLGEFPNCDQIIPTEPGPFKVCLDAILLAKLAEAMGTDGTVTLHLHPDNPLAVIYVTPDDATNKSDGAIMPIGFIIGFAVAAAAS